MTPVDVTQRTLCTLGVSVPDRQLLHYQTLIRQAQGRRESAKMYCRSQQPPTDGAEAHVKRAIAGRGGVVTCTDHGHKLSCRRSTATRITEKRRTPKSLSLEQEIQEAWLRSTHHLELHLHTQQTGQ